MNDKQVRLALYILQHFLIYCRRKVVEGASNRELEKLLDASEILPLYIANREQDRFEFTIKAISESHDIAYLWQLYEKGEVPSTW